MSCCFVSQGKFTGTAFPPATKSLSFGFVKPVFSLIKKGGEGEKNQVWEVRLSGTTTTVREGVGGDLGTSTDKEHTSAEEADNWVAAENTRRRNEGYVDNVPEAAPAAPFASLFGGFAEADRKQPEAPKFQGLFGNIGGSNSASVEAAGSKMEASSGEFKAFDMPKFGSASTVGGGSGGLSFGAAGSTSLTEGMPSGGFTSPFGAGAASEDKSGKTSFNEAAASKKDNADLKEMKSCKEKGLCCGAGGAQMFKESEKGNKEINIKRTEEALETKSEIIAASCPFCNTMLTDGIKNKEMDDKVHVYDVAELLDKST